MNKPSKAALPELRSTLVEVLAEATAPFELVVAAAETISLDARVDNWCVQQLKPHGTEDEIFSVLETTDRCSEECRRVWAAYKSGHATYSDLLVAVSAARDALVRTLPPETGEL